MMKAKSLTIVTSEGPDRYLNVEFVVANNILKLTDGDSQFCYPLYGVILYKFVEEEPQ
jgi:hypothetical protein